MKIKPQFSDILAKGQIVGTSCTVFMYNILNFLQYFVELELETLFNIGLTQILKQQNLYSIFLYFLLFQVRLQCRVNYRDTGEQLSAILTLQDSKYLLNTTFSVDGIRRKWFSCYYGVCEPNIYGNFLKSMEMSPSKRIILKTNGVMISHQKTRSKPRSVQ